MILDCLTCGMQSDNVNEYVNHCRDKHHRLVRVIDELVEAYKVWLEGNAGVNIHPLSRTAVRYPLACGCVKVTIRPDTTPHVKKCPACKKRSSVSVERSEIQAAWIARIAPVELPQSRLPGASGGDGDGGKSSISPPANHHPDGTDFSTSKDTTKAGS